MKILIYMGDDRANIETVLDYFRSTSPEAMPDVNVVDINPSVEDRGRMAVQEDITYVYFEEDITIGDALNQVISGLGLDDDILLMDSGHIPLMGAFDRLSETLSASPDVRGKMNLPSHGKEFLHPTVSTF